LSDWDLSLRPEIEESLIRTTPVSFANPSLFC
jgi:hypothetical protein